MCVLNLLRRSKTLKKKKKKGKKEGKGVRKKRRKKGRKKENEKEKWERIFFSLIDTDLGRAGWWSMVACLPNQPCTFKAHPLEWSNKLKSLQLLGPLDCLVWMQQIPEFQRMVGRVLLPTAWARSQMPKGLALVCLGFICLWFPHSRKNSVQVDQFFSFMEKIKTGPTSFTGTQDIKCISWCWWTFLRHYSFILWMILSSLPACLINA